MFEVSQLSVINPLIDGPYTFFANCPKCKSAVEVKVFKTAVTIAVKYLQHNRKYTAICTHCKTKYNVSKEMGDNLLLGKGALVLEE